MPQRLIRDWTASDKIDTVSFQAEVLFVRLLMKADDYGSFHANPKLINSFCFPLKNIRETEISRWLQELVSAGLIARYNADNKQYLNILNFGQRMRSKKNVFPNFDSNSPQLAAGCSNSPPEEEVEDEEEIEGEGDKIATPQRPVLDESFKKFQQWLSDNAPAVAKMKEPFTQEQYLKLLETCTKEEIATLCLKMHNWKELNKKNSSAYLTFKNWYNRDNK